MDEKLQKRLVNDIEKSGFLSELRVASTFVKVGWEVRNCVTYFDKDEAKNREVDVVAFNCTHNTKYHITVRLHLVAEIKSSHDRPWIVFTVPITDSFLLEPPGWLMIHETDDFNGDTLSREDIVLNSVRQGEARAGISFYEAFKSPQEPSQIYKALITACKGAISEQEPYLTDTEEEKEEQRRDSTNTDLTKGITFFQPVVVLDGMLVEARLDKSGKIKIAEKDYIPIVLGSFSPQYGEDPFYPDIVTMARLQTYISRLKKWLQSVEERIIKNLSK